MTIMIYLVMMVNKVLMYPPLVPPAWPRGEGTDRPEAQEDGSTRRARAGGPIVPALASRPT